MRRFDPRKYDSLGAAGIQNEAVALLVLIARKLQFHRCFADFELVLAPAVDAPYHAGFFSASACGTVPV